MADELKSALDAAARTADVHWTPSEVAVAVHRRADHRRRRRRLATVSAAGALVVASIGGAVALTSNDNDDRNVSIVDSTPDTAAPDVTTPDNPTTAVTTVDTSASVDTATNPVPTLPVPPTVPVVEPIEPALTIENPPLAARIDPVIEWVHTGDGDDHIVYWGGFVAHDINIDKPPFSDGAVWSRSTNAWRSMAPSPLTGGAVAAAVVGGIVVISDDAQVATYDVATDTWRSMENPIADRPLDADEVMTSVGNDVFFLQGGLAWNAQNDVWRAIAVGSGETAAGSERDVVAAPESVISVDPTSQGGLAVDQYDVASDTWTALPAPPGQHYGVAATVVAGNLLVLLSWWEMTAWQLDMESDEWTKLPSFPEFPVKCEPRLISYGPLVIGSMCGQSAILQGAHWRPFVAGSSASVLDELTLSGEIVLRGQVFDIEDGGEFMVPILRWAPLRLAGLTVDGSLQPGNVTNVDNETITLDLESTGCSLSVRRTPPDGQQAVSAAVASAANGPESVSWWNASGAYELGCPSPDAYGQSLAALRTEGERTSSVDALEQFAGQGPWGSVEEASTALAEFVEGLYTDQDTAPAIALGYFPEDPTTFTIESVGLADDSVSGQLFTITLRQSADRWSIETATVASVCSRGLALPDESLCI